MYILYNLDIKEMRKFSFNKDKNEKLQRERGVSFQQVINCLEADQELDVIKHPNSKYSNQQIFVVEINDYVYAVPFVEKENEYFLKTIFPSRKLTKKYLTKKPG